MWRACCLYEAGETPPGGKKPSVPFKQVSPPRNTLTYIPWALGQMCWQHPACKNGLCACARTCGGKLASAKNAESWGNRKSGCSDHAEERRSPDVMECRWMTSHTNGCGKSIHQVPRSLSAQKCPRVIPPPNGWENTYVRFTQRAPHMFCLRNSSFRLKRNS